MSIAGADLMKSDKNGSIAVQRPFGDRTALSHFNGPFVLFSGPLDIFCIIQPVSVSVLVTFISFLYSTTTLRLLFGFVVTHYCIIVVLCTFVVTHY